MKKKKIMVVDDEIDLTMLLEHIFLSTGLYDVVTANSGKEAQKIALKEKPDLIFLDFLMPGVRGDQVLQFLRSRTEFEKTPVVMMSGLGGDVYLDDQDSSGQTGGVFSENSGGDNGPGSVFYDGLIKKYHVTAMLPKPFTSKELKALAETIFRQEEAPGM